MIICLRAVAVSFNFRNRIDDYYVATRPYEKAELLVSIDAVG